MWPRMNVGFGLSLMVSAQSSLYYMHLAAVGRDDDGVDILGAESDNGWL